MRTRGLRGRRRATVELGLAAAVALALATTGATRLEAQDADPTTSTEVTTSTEATTSSTEATTSSTDDTTSSTEATTSSTTPGPDCGGTTVLKADGTPWHCTFDDEFDGTTLDPAWVPQETATSGFTSGTECVVDSPDNISVGDGVLHLTARQEDAPFTCPDPNGDFTTQYTSASVSTTGTFSQTYGRFEVRAAFPHVTVPGVQETLWLWPDDPFRYGYWPWSGEIDFAEAYSQYPDRVIPFVHYAPGFWDWNSTNNYCLVQDIWAFHTYEVEWTPETITIRFDGQTCLVDDWGPAPPLVKPQPFDQPFFVALTQALGQNGNAFDPSTTPLPATTQVDWVRVWK